MMAEQVARFFSVGAAVTLALALGPVGASAATSCTALSGGSQPLCSTDNSQTNSATISSNPTQTNESVSKGGDGGSASASCDIIGLQIDARPLIPSCTFSPTALPSAAVQPVAGGGNGGGALSLNEQHQATSSSVAQTIDSHNASRGLDGEAAAVSQIAPIGVDQPLHRVVVGGREFVAAGLGGASFVALPVGGASNTGAAAVTP